MQKAFVVCYALALEYTSHCKKQINFSISIYAQLMKRIRYKKHQYLDIKPEGLERFVPFIKAQLIEFDGYNDLSWKLTGIGNLSLENDKIELCFFAEYRVYDAIGIGITDKIKKQHYTFTDIIERKGFGQPASYMTESEIAILKSLNDPIKWIIYDITVFINKHGKDIMSGDFTSVGEGDLAYHLL
ncbi:MAG: hypothetical protein KA149_02615 [Chitinophagales bacterium]|nr:hypothetical protein [Chitinophagales bacterium]